MKIINLQIDNFMRLKAIEITPEGALIDIAGKNAAGKTSILNAIYAALAGASALPSKPIRKGADSARIQVKLGDGTTVQLIVRRTFKTAEDGSFTTSVVVENADGARYGSPQKVLDGLLGALSFDPLAFARMPAKEQLGELRKLVPGFDFDAADEANADDFTRRTEINRRARQMRAQLEGLKVPGDPRQQRVDESALVAELNAAGETKAEIEKERARRYLIKDAVTELECEAETLADTLEQLKKQIAEYERDLAAARVKLEAKRADFAALPPLADPPNTAELMARIDAARRTNLEVTTRERVLAERADLTNEIAVEEAESKALTKNMEQRDARKAEAIAAAKLPIEGLGLGADGVLFNGLPFDQASDAERLRVSVAIAAAMNPKLRVVRIRDGSLLDADGVRAIAEFAEKHDLQIWREVVADGAKTGIVIEDGRLASEAAA
jgi:DNA repair exonuclease SbcCD ATPase subunit